MRQRLLIILWVACSFSVSAQIVGEMEDESRLYAQTKQVNQFFRRFNGEEDEKGERYYPGDKQYRSVKLRRKYLGVLFDGSNAGITSDVKNSFARDVLDKAEPGLLDFHKGNWFSEVQTTFTLYGKDVPVTLFMELENAQVGSKWVINRVYCQAFERAFARDTAKVGEFLHPLSHELDFMNLRKAFSSDSATQFAMKRFEPDHLSVFLYEIKKGGLRFRSVQEVKFHFFQIDGWYFELSDFNRPGYNTGWLISNLVRIGSLSDKELMRKHLFYESR